MINFYIVTPTFNDWNSLNKLLISLNKSIKGIKGKFKIIVVNDCSTEKSNLRTKNLKNIKNIKILNLNKNVGSQKAIYIGLKYVEKLKLKSLIAILDSDGEDDPFKLKKLINLAIKKRSFIIVGNRSKRKENVILKILNYLRLLITLLLTGRYINFGNYSAFSSENLKNIFSNNNLWLAYSSGILKNCKNIQRVNIDKRERYYGKSKVDFKFLLNHSIKILCVFRKEIFIRSFFIMSLLIIIFENTFLNMSLLIFTFILNIFIYIYFQINNLCFDALKLIKSTKNLKNH
jgi:hypothetical protein